MFKSKHSGWTWEMKRTPFGGGGILGSIGHAIQNGGESVGNWTADNGWMIPLAMITAGVSSGALGAGALTAEGGAAAGSAELAGPSLAGSQAFDAAIASGASTAEASAAADAAAQAAIGTGQGIGTATGASVGGAISPDVFSGYSPSGSAAGTASNTVNSGFAANSVGQAAYDAAIANGSSQAAAQTAGDAAYKSYLVIGGSGQTAGLTAGEDLAQLMKSYPNLSQSQLESIMSINYGTDPIVSADAANLANAGYNADAINQVLGYSYNPTELAGTGIDSSALNPSSGLNLSDTLKAAKNAKSGLNLAKLLTQGAASGLTKSLGKLASGANPTGANQLQIVRGNQNPFVYTPQQPIQDTKQTQLASLLRQG